MKRWIAAGFLIVLVSGMVLMSGCTDTGSAVTAPVAAPAPQIADTAVPVPPTPAPAVPAAPAPSLRDPIIGSWLNGMVFYDDGTVGSDGTARWTANRNANYSYFVISDIPSGGANNQRNVTAAEWIYNPYSDTIHRRGSQETFSRKILPPVTGTITPCATVLAPATAVPAKTTPAATPAAAPTEKKTVATTPAAVPAEKKTVTTTPTAVPAEKTPVAPTTAVPPEKTPVTATTAVPVYGEGGTGSLFIHTGGVGTGVVVYVARQGTDVLPINELYDSGGNVLENRTTGYIQVNILPDGNSEMVSLATGNYIAYLPGKNGGPVEQQSFTMNANCNTVISFSAYSYRASSGGGCGG